MKSGLPSLAVQRTCLLRRFRARLHIFFGRERESEVVAANLMASRLTVLYGPSGVGKSSLLRAGVARRLRTLVPARGEGGDGNGALPVVVDQWRDDPLAAIAAAAGTPVPESPEELADVLAERSAQIGGEAMGRCGRRSRRS